MSLQLNHTWAFPWCDHPAHAQCRSNFCELLISSQRTLGSCVFKGWDLMTLIVLGLRMGLSLLRVCGREEHGTILWARLGPGPDSCWGTSDLTQHCRYRNGEEGKERVCHVLKMLLSLRVPAGVLKTLRGPELPALGLKLPRVLRDPVSFGKEQRVDTSTVPSWPCSFPSGPGARARPRAAWGAPPRLAPLRLCGVLPQRPPQGQRCQGF